MTPKEMQDWNKAVHQMLKLIPKGKLTLLYAYLKGAIETAEAMNNKKEQK